MKLSFKIAYKFLKSNELQTILIALAIGIGISIQLFLGLLIQNLQSGLFEIDNGKIANYKLKKTS